MNRFAIVSFDFTNTIVKFRYTTPAVYARVALEHGVVLEEERVEKSFRTSYKKLWYDHPNFGHESIGCREFWRKVVSSCLIGAGLKGLIGSKELRTRISDHLYDAFATDEFWELDCSTAPVLEAIRAEHCKLIVISNMDERLEVILKSLKIREYFDAVVTSYETGITKPDRQIFDHALAAVDKSKRFAAHSAVHIGDDFDKDYNGARNAGWSALWLNERKESKRIPHDHVVTSLQDVPQRLHRMDVGS